MVGLSAWLPELSWITFFASLLLVAQLLATAILLARLIPGMQRPSPLVAQATHPDQLATVSVVVPTLNEVDRLAPCLQGLTLQGYAVREILVVDSQSTDGTQALVNTFQQQDPRLRLLNDGALPPGWVGRPWALDYGFRHSSTASTWILGIDADTRPQVGLVAALAQAMEEQHYDLVSLAPQFILKTPGEFWLQPALLITLVYRFGAVGTVPPTSQRVMANGQCFMVRRDLLERLDGYQAARTSFCDDVTLARYAAAQGARVGFWDGSKLLQVRMYEGMAETWREWGRSLDLKDASSPLQLWGDWLFLLLVQGLPWLLTPALMALKLSGEESWYPPLAVWLWLNLGLLVLRLGLQVAIASSYCFDQAPGRWVFWLSPLADLGAVLRIGLSSWRRPNQWRGRQYPEPSPSSSRA
jgi:dolichol-phosphate mannosyltransferase